MFDLKKMAIRWETNVKNGVRRLYDLLVFADISNLFRMSI